MMEFHLVSNGRMHLNEFSKIAGRVAPYVDFIHIREKHRSAQDITSAINKLKEESIPSENIIVNDRVDIASVEGVRGVQLAYHSIGIKEVRKHFPQFRIGKSVHSVMEAQEAETDGADYVLFGHIFSSNSKPGLMPKGVEALKDVVDATSIPVIAIGGITPQNVHEIRRTGAKGIAVMSGLLDAHDPYQMAQEYKKGWVI
ncbi:transcriptional regulator [Pontibacillus marinus BH030004 = DSM 16465]|uniref:Transcriptional regulator n=1 Tax=Pontibacillus marinus BH030004 = DSM 16465 TaxID=1385511 RepID=A0A0A5G5W0_9BACI|nr:transcriptional regulator [Pontibacillus marinus BH030004 = DSM 16465]